MNFLILNGSPRKFGTTASVLKVLNKVLASKGFEVLQFDIASLNISPCTECLSCYKKEGCIIIDPMITIYEKIKTADVIIFASPVFFSGPSAQLKALIDRLQAFWALKHILNKEVRAGSPLTGGIVVGSRGSEIDLRNTVSIFKAATSAFNGVYAGTLSILNAENPENLPPAPELKRLVLNFLENFKVK